MRTRTLLTLPLSLLAVAGLSAADPYNQPDESWISISGTVASPTSDSFTLDYGEGVVLVEMDDWDSYGDAYGLIEGDDVTVYGRIDDDFYEVTSIEASSVYVDDLNTYFYASADDEEDLGVWAGPTVVLSTTTVNGTVTSVDPAAREFTIDTDTRKLTVETEVLGYNPFDNKGYQKIEKGDRVSVSGDIDLDFFEGRVLDATSIITLDDASRSEKKS